MEVHPVMTGDFACREWFLIGYPAARFCFMRATDYFVDVAAQSHPGIAGRHPHGIPIHHLEDGHGLRSFNRRGPPSVGA